MTYRTDPLIPQQAESVKDVVIRRPGQWTGREMVAGADGVWHLMLNPNRRTAMYPTVCKLVIEAREARTLLSGDPTCSACLQKRRAAA